MSLLSTQKCFHFKNTLCKNGKFNYLVFNNRWSGSTTQNLLNGEKEEKFLPFLDMIKMRQSEAKRSILVQVQSVHSFKELYSYCSLIGKVKHMHHYTSGVEPMNFMIVEFSEENEVKEILTESSHFEDPHIVPVHSNFLWFKASAKKTPKLKQNKSAKLSSENGTQIVKDSELKRLLIQCDTVSEQMNVLHKTTKLNDLGTRLRFLTALQIERSLTGMFPQAVALPFGSSVNGYGRMGCDLDVILRLLDDKKDDDARLIFHCKAAQGSERTTAQRNMEAIGDIIQLFLPGCAQVRRILQARVPIIKYYQQLTDVECDLSMSNTSGLHMSDLLYVMGGLDERVRPLVFTIRKWASEIGITNSAPGRWITNFSLTLLVLAFLQKPINSPPILPTINQLVKLSSNKDKYVTEDGINCTFLRNVNNYKEVTKNSENLESLLSEFFEYYSQFDFETKAVCLNEAVLLTKPEHSALYIVNPLERGLNVSKNVSLEELEHFKLECRNAAWLLQSQENKSGNWGLLSLFEHKRKIQNTTHILAAKHSRLMDVSTLFEEESTTETIRYKNPTVKKQVQDIKKEHQNNLNELRIKSNR